MPKVVVFTHNNARLLHAEDVTSYKDRPDAVIDPDLTEVRFLSPDMWKVSEGRIIPLSEEEIKARLGQTTAPIACATPEALEIAKPASKSIWPLIVALLSGGAISLIIQNLLRR